MPTTIDELFTYATEHGWSIQIHLAEGVIDITSFWFEDGDQWVRVGTSTTVLSTIMVLWSNHPRRCEATEFLSRWHGMKYPREPEGYR